LTRGLSSTIESDLDVSLAGAGPNTTAVQKAFLGL
jgi:hypothetical protein